MIRLSILTGPNAGRETRTVSYISTCLANGWAWQVDYSEASQEEALEWFKVDLICRVIRALREGRPVLFLEREWRCAPEDNIQNTAQAVEDAVVASGRLVTIDSDDERGLVIGVGGWEQ